MKKYTACTDSEYPDALTLYDAVIYEHYRQQNYMSHIETTLRGHSEELLRFEFVCY